MKPFTQFQNIYNDLLKTCFEYFVDINETKTGSVPLFQVNKLIRSQK